MSVSSFFAMYSLFLLFRISLFHIDLLNANWKMSPVFLKPFKDYELCLPLTLTKKKLTPRRHFAAYENLRQWVFVHKFSFLLKVAHSESLLHTLWICLCAAANNHLSYHQLPSVNHQLNQSSVLELIPLELDVNHLQIQRSSHIFSHILSSFPLSSRRKRKFDYWEKRFNYY